MNTQVVSIISKAVVYGAKIFSKKYGIKLARGIIMAGAMGVVGEVGRWVGKKTTAVLDENDKYERAGDC